MFARVARGRSNDDGVVTTTERIASGLEQVFGLLDSTLTDGWADLGLVGRSLPSALAGVTATDPGSFLRLFEAGASSLRLDEIGTLDVDQLRTRLDALDAVDGNVHVSASPDGTEFDVTVAKRLAGEADIGISTEHLGGLIDLDGRIDLDAEVALHLVFGVDASGFYLDTEGGVSGLTVRDLAGTGEAQGRFGFVGVTLNDAVLAVDPALALALTLDEPAGDGLLREAELADALTDADQRAETLGFGVDGSAAADLSISGDMRVSAFAPGGAAAFELGAAQVSFAWDDIEQPLAVSPSLGAGNGQALFDLLRVDAQAILDRVQQLTGFADSFAGIDVPLVQGTLDQMVAVADGIRDAFVAPLSDAGGLASFDTIQALLLAVATRAGVDPSSLGLGYDTTARELTWDLRAAFNASHQSRFDLGFDLESGLADLSFSSDAAIQSQFDLAVRLGIDLDDLTANQDDADGWLFVRSANAKASLAITGDDIDANARFGFLSIGIVDGTVDASAGFTLALQEPPGGNGDGRIGFDEWGQSLAQAEVDVDGKADIRLPVEVPFIGITAGPDTAIALDWKDVTDFDTLSVEVPEALNLDKFGNMNAGTLVGLLRQVGNWLADMQNTSAFAADLPLVGKALKSALDLAELVQDTLLYDDHDTKDDKTDDTAKLLDANGNPTFRTAQEFGQKLVDVLGSDVVTYDTASESLVVNLLLKQDFLKTSVPLDFDLNLGQIAGVKGSGNLDLSADGELGIKLGIYLGEEGYVSLSRTTELSSLRGGGVVFEPRLVAAAEADVGVERGRLTGDAVFRVSMDNVNGGAPVVVVVPKGETDFNLTLLDLVDDVQAGIDAAMAGEDFLLKGKIKVGSEGRRLTFTATDDATESLEIDAEGVAADELGLGDTIAASTAHILVTTRNGVRHEVSFGDIGDGGTLGDVIDAIESQTAGAVTVEFTDGDSRLRLTDTTATGDAVFRIENAIGSDAASRLGILGADVTDDTETPDHLIDSAPLGGVDVLDRLYIENAHASAGFEIDTPDEGAVLDAKFGFVNVKLQGDGHLEGKIAMELQDPGTSKADGRITLKELIEGLSDIDTLIDAPEVGGNGSLTFKVDANPSFGLITPGDEPTVTVTMSDIGDPFKGELPTVDVTTAGFDQLGKFSEIGLADILAGLTSLGDFLKQFEQFGFLDQKIPLIDVSVNDMLSYADQFAKAVQRATDNPADSIQGLDTALKEAFGLPKDSNLLGLSLVKDGDASFLRFDLAFKPAFSESLPIGFKLPTQGFAVSGGADLHTKGDVDLKLAFGLNMADPLEVVIFGDTGIQGHIEAKAEDIAFAIGLGNPDGGPFVGGKIIGGSLGIEGGFGSLSRTTR
ncbi:MAG: hypothetical protein IPK20_20525 [Betaproteobacteria bacterium]|nr:hypothetical protein [Betaproteobacteria bacterium]